jgi:2-methylisocitrate lyase-like PEP mutase family enzyme
MAQMCRLPVHVTADIEDGYSDDPAEVAEFVAELMAADDIRSITAGIGLPVNALAHPAPTIDELGELGVRRVSSGSLPYRAAVDAAVNSVTALRDGKQVPGATPYSDIQARLIAFSQESSG